MAAVIESTMRCVLPGLGALDAAGLLRTARGARAGISAGLATGRMTLRLARPPGGALDMVMAPKSIDLEYLVYTLCAATQANLALDWPGSIGVMNALDRSLLIQSTL